eukprot:1122822-Amorphochlora_amoeboformis.AAC.2
MTTRPIRGQRTNFHASPRFVDFRFVEALQGGLRVGLLSHSSIYPQKPKGLPLLCLPFSSGLWRYA